MRLMKAGGLALALTFVGGAAFAAEAMECCCKDKDGKMSCCDKMKDKAPAAPGPAKPDAAKEEHKH